MAWLEGTDIVIKVGRALRSPVTDLAQRFYWEVRDLLSPLRERRPAKASPFRVLFVCFGNICRSPLAEEIFRDKLIKMGLADVVDVDSAGTSAANIGRRPHWKARACAVRHGLRLGHARARLFIEADYNRFDRILVMDQRNREDVLRVAPSQEHQARVRLLLDFAGGGEIPDPVDGAAAEFEGVFRKIDAACDGLVADVARDIQRLAATPVNPTLP